MKAPQHSTGTAGEQLFLLPPPPFAPTWPKRGTLADRALAMLMDGRLIDHPDFEGSTQSWRLGAVIFTLRSLGWPVRIQAPASSAPSIGMQRMVAFVFSLMASSVSVVPSQCA